MKNNLIQMICIASLAVICQGVLGLPWWSAVVSAFIGGALIRNKGFYAFCCGFMAVFLVWFLWAIIKDSSADSILSSQVGQLFPGKPGPVLLAVLAGVVAGIPAGFGSWCGNLGRKMM